MKIASLWMLGAVAAAPLVQSARAQTEPALVQIPAKTWHSLPLKNVAPRVMAWWLDSKNNPAPAELSVPMKPFTMNGREFQMSRLPDGVDKVIAAGAGNEILVLGTIEGVVRLRSTVTFLDKPVRQVELTASFVLVSNTDSRAFGINYGTQDGIFDTGALRAEPATSELKVGFARGNFEASLTALQNASRAKVLTAPRVLAINNLNASLEMSSTPANVQLGAQDEKGALFAVTPLSPLQLRSVFTLVVTPTINNDDTITMLMKSSGVKILGRDGETKTLPLQNLFDFLSVANVKDGETIALGGFKPEVVAQFLPTAKPRPPLPENYPFGRGLFRSKNAQVSTSELIVFITPRIVRRVGE